MSDVARLGGRPPRLLEAATDEALLAAGRGILDGTVRADVQLLDGPHILVCTDTETGTTTYTGPYGTAYDALAHLADHEADQQPRPGARTVTCSLAPLLPG